MSEDDWKGEHLIRAKPNQKDGRLEAGRLMAAKNFKIEKKAKKPKKRDGK